MPVLSFRISSFDGFELIKSWLAFVVKLSIALVFAFNSFSADTGCWLMFCEAELGLTVVAATELKVVGVGLLLIRLSTRAEVTLVCIDVVKVLASGGTIGMNGIGCGGKIV